MNAEGRYLRCALAWPSVKPLAAAVEPARTHLMVAARGWFAGWASGVSLPPRIRILKWFLCGGLAGGNPLFPGFRHAESRPQAPSTIRRVSLKEPRGPGWPGRGQRCWAGRTIPAPPREQIPAAAHAHRHPGAPGHQSTPASAAQEPPYCVGRIPMPGGVPFAGAHGFLFSRRSGSFPRPRCRLAKSSWYDAGQGFGFFPHTVNDGGEVFWWQRNCPWRVPVLVLRSRPARRVRGLLEGRTGDPALQVRALGAAGRATVAKASRRARKRRMTRDHRGLIQSCSTGCRTPFSVGGKQTPTTTREIYRRKVIAAVLAFAVAGYPRVLSLGRPGSGGVPFYYRRRT